MPANKKKTPASSEAANEEGEFDLGSDDLKAAAESDKEEQEEAASKQGDAKTEAEDAQDGDQEMEETAVEPPTKAKKSKKEETVA
jgi:hypothetical protein